MSLRVAKNNNRLVAQPAKKISVRQAKGLLANPVRVSQPATDFLAAIAEHDQQSKK
jgi:hypothetical protein